MFYPKRGTVNPTVRHIFWSFMGIIKLTYNSSFKLFIDGAASSSGMFLSGLIIVTRNRYGQYLPFWMVTDFRACFLLTTWQDRFLAWTSLLFGLVTSINEHPLRLETSALHGWSNLAYVLINSHQSNTELPLKLKRAKKRFFSQNGTRPQVIYAPSPQPHHHPLHTRYPSILTSTQMATVITWR